ncbi:MAG: cupredoxin domain-containing protein [Acidobacteriota bacterium]
MRRKFYLPIFIALLCFITPALSRDAVPAEKVFSGSSECRKCHDLQYWAWYASMHARSVNSKNILFTKIFDIAMEESRGTMRDKCLSCHAPIAVALNDLNLKRDISEEGITCDYCHTLKGEKREGEYFNIVSSPGDTKYGPFTDSSTEAHKSEFSEIYAKSDFCFKCHSSMKNPSGLEICSTDVEWSGSWYAQKKMTCQECHMPAVPGKAAPTGPDRENIHLHNFFGGHDTGILTKAARVDIRTEDSESGRKLIVAVTNTGTGHDLPTASPLRMIFLKLYAYDPDGKELWTNWKDDPVAEDQQAVFARILTDETGEPTFSWKATKVALDSRLKAREQKELTYMLPSELNIAKITANLQYKLAPDSLLRRLKIDESDLKTLHTIARAELSINGGEVAGPKIVVKQPEKQEQQVMRTIKVYSEKFKFTPDEIKIKQGERVKLIIYTLDDTHGFRCKKLGINVKVFRDKPAEIEIEGKEKGEYPFDCSHPCGDRCFKMKGVIIVE